MIERADLDDVPADARSAIRQPLGGDDRLLAAYAGTYRDVQQLRLATTQRGIAPAFVEAMELLEGKLAKAARRELRRHPMWPWLEDHPGLGGVQVATLLARIGNPHRFPGQPCSLGHIVPPDRAVGSACPATAGEEQCPGVMLEPRPGTGVRALWHYAGLHVVDGRAPRFKRGQRADWDSRVRTCLLMPHGIADQIVMKRLEPWRSIYDATKARKLAGDPDEIQQLDGEPAADTDAIEELDGRLAETRTATDVDHGEPKNGGPADTTTAIEARNGGPADSRCAIGTGSGGPATDLSDRAVVRNASETRVGTVTPARAHAIARTVAAKQFAADLLVHWKGIKT